MIKRVCCILIAVNLSCSLPHAQQILFKTYTRQNGLVANQVRRVIQDSKGFIWIATWEGLSKYDGNKFTNYSTTNGLAFNLINDIFEDKDGKIYIAQNNGNLDIIVNDQLQKTEHENITVNQFFQMSDNSIYASTDHDGLVQFKDGR